MDQTQFPLPQKTLKDFASAAFKPLVKNQSVTVFFTAGAGKRTVIPFLLKQKDILKHVLGDNFDDLMFVFINQDDLLEHTSLAFLELLEESIDREFANHNLQFAPIGNRTEKNILSALEEDIDYLERKNMRLVLIINDFENLFLFPDTVFRNLERLSSFREDRLMYMFLTSVNILKSPYIDKLSNLKYTVTDNIVYRHLLDRSEADFLINSVSDKINFPVPDRIKETIWKVCGGHPQIIKYAVHILATNETKVLQNPKVVYDYLKTHPQLGLIAADVWNAFSEKEQGALLKALFGGVSGSADTSDLGFLLNLGVITVSEGKLRVFGDIFEYLLTSKIPQARLSYDDTKRQFLLGLKDITYAFSPQEAQLLRHFITHEGDIVSREEVARILWRSRAEEKYSDWTIDKLISNLRKKLERLEFDSKRLVTMKKHGFYFSQTDI